MNDYDAAVKLWRDWNVETEADIDRRLDNFRILFAYNSGRIENMDITYSDMQVFEFLKPKLAAKEPLTVALIKEIHGVLTGGTYDERRYVCQGERPGEFKKHDYVTGLAEVGSTPEDVEGDLSDLVDELNEYADRDALKVASYFHARFEYIHPFADGNGRVGRTLLNYYLMGRNHPPLIVHDGDKADYYAALAAYDNEEDLRPMETFLRKQSEKTWAKTLKRRPL